MACVTWRLLRPILVVVLATAIVACETTTEKHPAGSYVPWLPLPRGNVYPLPPPPSPPIPVPPGTALCRAPQLDALLAGEWPAMGNTDTPVVLRNNASEPCYIDGIPDVTIVDGFGSVLAQAAGADGVGTYFDATSTPVAVMLEVGTPPLTVPAGFDGGQGLSAGQAFINVEWSGCGRRPAAKLYLDLPGGAGRVVVDYPVIPKGPETCNPSTPLTRGPLNPTGILWPPSPNQTQLVYGIDSPVSAKRGSRLVFFVTVQNRSSNQDYLLSPCPDYTEALVPGGPVVNYQLNCSPVGAIKTGQGVTFQMKFDIPASTRTGQWNLLFGLVDGRVDPPSGQTPITIT
jgi:uncharacterized protein DUF4232